MDDAIKPDLNRPLTRKESEVIQSYKRVFGSVDGQIVLRDLSYFCHYNATTMPFGSPIDPIALAMAEGERNVCLRILTFLQIKG